MKMNSMKKMLCLIGCVVLIAAMALTLTGCGGSSATTEAGSKVSFTSDVTTGKKAVGEALLEEGLIKVSFTVVVTDPEGTETTFDVTTDKETVGEALLEEGLIAGEDSEFGLYVTTVNGITLDWDKDQMYWAFYIDGEYAQTGVDSTNVAEGTVYSFKAEG